MASSFFQLGYHPTNSPALDVSGNLGIALRGFDRLGNNLETFGANLAKADQDAADRIYAERMNQYKTEADLMNAIQSGKIYDGISGRVSAKVSQQGLQDRLAMLTKDEERRKYENKLQFDKLGDYRSKIYAAAQMGNAALAGKLLQEAAIKEGATGSVVDMLKEDANPSRQALTAAGHLGLERQKYGDNKRLLEEKARFRQKIRDEMKDANTPEKKQASWDRSLQWAKDNGFSYEAIDDGNEYVGKLEKTPGFFGYTRVSSSTAEPWKYIPGTFVTDSGERVQTKDVINTTKSELSADRQGIVSAAANLDVEKFQKTVDTYDKPDLSPKAAAQKYIDTFKLNNPQIANKASDWIVANAAKKGLSVPYFIGLLSNSGKFEEGIKRDIFPDTDPSFSIDEKQVQFLKDVSDSEKHRKALITVNKYLNNNRSIDQQLDSLQSQKESLQTQILQAKLLWDTTHTEQARINLNILIARDKELDASLNYYNNQYNKSKNNKEYQDAVNMLKGAVKRSNKNLTVEQQIIRQKQQEALNQAISY